MKKGTVFSGVQPTGELHIGNYLGAIRNWVDLQEKYDCFYCIVDYHALTSDFNPRTLRSDVVSLAMDLLACGVDPSKCVLFIQSQVSEHAELSWILGCFTSYGDLTRMTQFKDKERRAEFVNAGLFSYPILQAADILLYRAGWVPVGEDQLQHLEITRRIARRFNNQVGQDFFPVVKPILSKGSRVMSPADPSQKMSKSLGPSHYIGLGESEDVIWKKIKTAVTDKGLEEGAEMSSGVENLFTILRNTGERSLVNSLEEKHQSGELLYKELKETAFESLMGVLRPIRERREGTSEEETILKLREGREKAAKVAEENMKAVRNLLGIPELDFRQP
jgi:tryptophanyl-tRNA synthetase